jgi:hypothetical protein
MVLALGTLLPSAFAQGPTAGSISGIVTDPSGAVLPDVKISVSSPAIPVPQNTVTGAGGNYRVLQLPPGVYEVSVEAPGFAIAKRENITISAGFNATIDVAMSVAGQSQSVAVTAEAPLIDVENTNIQNTFQAATIRNLPTGRDMWTLMAVAPGLSVARFDVGGSTVGTQTTYYSYGMRGQQRVSMDGVNMTEGNNATSAYNDLGSFAEVQMGTTGNDASMPTPGVQVNFIVKTGGNQFHGNFYQDYENGSFQGTNISPLQLNQGAGQGQRTNSYRDTNGDIGGPIFKDKLWFYASARRQFSDVQVTGYPANKPGTAAFPTKLDNLTYKLTYQLSTNNRISQFMNMNRKQQPFRDAGSTRYEDAVYKQDFPQWVANLQWDSTLSPRAFLTARAGTWGYNWTNTAYAGPSGVVENRRQELATGNLAGGFNPQRFGRKRLQFEPTFSYSVDHFLGASHFLSIGFLTEKETYAFEQYPYKDAQLWIYNSPGLADFTTPSQITISNNPGLPTDYLRHNGAYIQDKVKVTRRLTLNLGVRWDYYNNYRPDQKIRNDAPYNAFFYQGAALPNGYSIAPTFPNLTIPGADGVMKYPNSWAPRVGFVYDLFGTGKTTIKASWGRYYENPSLAITTTVNPVANTTYTFGWNDTNGDKKFQNNEFGAFRGNAGGTSFTIDPNIKHPYMDDYNMFVEHEVMRNVVFRAGFVYRKLAREWVLVESGRPASLYTQARIVTDPGADGTTPKQITVWDLPTGAPGSVQQWQTPEDNKSLFRNIDLSVTKRMSNNWMLTGSYLATWANRKINGSATDGFATGNGITNATLPLNPNTLAYNEARTYDSNFKVFGTYNAKWGIVISPIYRFQLGQQLGRYLVLTTYPNPSGSGTLSFNSGTRVVPVEQVGAYRQDNVSIFDVRIEKQFKFKDRYQLGAFFDAFNINNSNANQAQDNVTGTRTASVNGSTVTYQRYLSPTTIVSPRIFRLGVKFSF